MLYNNPISDISALSGSINLTYLGLYNNSISDISAIAGLTNLTRLWLAINSITDISALAGLTNLTDLWLYGNSISDLSPLVENTGLGDRDFVNVQNNYLNALSINTHIPALRNRGVTVRFDNIIVRPEDIAQTVDIPDPNLHAAIAQIRGKMPSDPITMADMLLLVESSLSDAKISDLTGLEQATNLINLDVTRNSISDFSPLAGLINLRQLSLGNNSITDISPLAGLTNLTSLELEDNNIIEISAIAGLNKLMELSLANNSISDISPLAGLNNLWWLQLANNSISDISPLAGLTRLDELHIANNSTSDLSPLVENTALGNKDFVDVTGNPLSTLSITTHIPTLQARRVIVEFDNIIAQTPDVNSDGNVNILDLISVANMLGNEGQNLAEDVNADGSVNILDLVLVAGMFDAAAAAPSAYPQAAELLSAAAVRGWLTDAKALQIQDPIMERGVMVLQQLLASLIPTETRLLANYPNPFNPETWIPYRLAKDAFVTLTIYDGAGHVVRTIDVGHQIAATYENRAEAIYWNGRNQIGEKVASGVYFYHLSAGDFSATRKMLILK